MRLEKIFPLNYNRAMDKKLFLIAGSQARGIFIGKKFRRDGFGHQRLRQETYGELRERQSKRQAA